MRNLLTLFIVLFLFSKGINAQTSISALNNSLWKITYTDGMTLLMEMEISGNNFVFHTRKGSSHDITGGKYWLARMMKKVPKTTIEFTGTWNVKNDTVFLEGNYRSLTNRLPFKGWIYKNEMAAQCKSLLLQGNLTTSQLPLRDYNALLDSLIEVTERNIYNSDLLSTKGWIDFKKHMYRYIPKIKDDYEFKTGINFATQSLPFSHFGLEMIPPEKPKQTNQNTTTVQAQPQYTKFEIKQLDNETVLFNIKTFVANAYEIQPYLDTLEQLNPQKLIIDLRENNGGSISSALPLARFLFSRSFYGGVFLTRKYFNRTKQLPDTSEYKNFTIFNEASFELIIDGIHRQEGLCLLVEPGEKTYRGEVIVLTGRYTASTCEPLVYGLQSTKRAVIIGENTMGAMLNGERFAISTNFRLWVPTADYYTADGIRLDKIGVKPDIQVKREEALNRALQYLNQGIH